LYVSKLGYYNHDVSIFGKIKFVLEIKVTIEEFGVFIILCSYPVLTGHRKQKNEISISW